MPGLIREKMTCVTVVPGFAASADASVSFDGRRVLLAGKAKPGDLSRRPPQIAPYHLRIDWLMWFAALSPRYAEGWFVPFALRLLDKVTMV